MDITGKMDKTETCAVIKYLFLKGMPGKDIRADMLSILGEMHLHIMLWNRGLPNLNVVE